MPDVITKALGYLNELSSGIGNLLHPFISFILVVGALIIVLGCLWTAFDHLRNIRHDLDVLGAAAMGADVVVAAAMLALAGAGDALTMLYLVATGALALGIRLGLVKLVRGK